MAKNERKRTMVYSNVNKKKNNKKADSTSASENDEIIDLDNEVVIGLASFPKPNEVNKKKKKKKFKGGQPVDKSNKKSSKKEQITNSNKVTSKKIEVSQEKISQPLTTQEKIKIQKRRAIKKMGVILLLLILAIGALVYFFLSPVFNVKNINVINNNYIAAEQIINLSEIKVNENIFKFSKKHAQKNILTNPYIEDVKISRNIFNDSVKIDVKERVATLMLEYGNSYVYINNQGYILEISSVKIDSPIIKGYVTPLEDVKPGNRLNKDDLERLEVVLNIIETANSNGIGDLITHIDVSNSKDYVMILESEDKTVYLGNCLDLSTQMLYVKEMIQREKGIEGEFFIDMDLNNANPVFREKV